jgi:hypothetical protein
MNERIKELAEQAGFSKDRFDLFWDEDANAEGVDLEKFAELIVQECAALAKSKSEHIQSITPDDHDDQIHLHSLAWQFEEFGYEIKKHFGVK